MAQDSLVGSTNAIPVLALTVIAQGAPSRVLTVVRRPESNLSHPNVVCVPTQRIPPALARDLVGGLEVVSASDAIFHFDGPRLGNARLQTNTALIYAVDSLMTRKLGLAAALEQRILHYEAHVAVLMRGISDVADRAEDSIVTQRVDMINVAVRIELGDDLFPPESASYSRICWTDVTTFLDVASTRDVTKFSESLNIFEFCMRGLCVRTTCETLKRWDFSSAFVHATEGK